MLSKKNNVIIALGGGTVKNVLNRDIINSSGLMIYLESSAEVAYKRLKFKRDRPALLFDENESPTEEEFVNKINTLLEQRKEFYEKADYIVNTDHLPVGKTVDKIVRIIEKHSISN
jgi:shikimate kinase